MQKPSWIQPQLWVPLGAFIIGVLTPVSPVLVELVRQRVDERVYEATHAEKKRVLEAQSTLLSLQEAYLKKLEEVRDAQERLASNLHEMGEERARTRIREQQLAQQQVELEQRLLTTAKSEAMRCFRLAKDEKERKEQAAATAESARQEEARLRPWRAHVCTFSDVPKKRIDRDRLTWELVGGARVVFAPGTPDERVIAEHQSVTCRRRETSPDPTPGTLQRLQLPWDRFDEEQCEIELRMAVLKARAAARQECNQHQKRILSTKGLSEEDLLTLDMEQIARDLTESRSKPE